jgi:hypothetical protein
VPKRRGRDITSTKRTLRVTDFRDTDLLAHIAEQGADGVTSAELGALIGYDDIEGHRSVGSRFARMRAYGMLAFDEKRRLWTVTEGAERVLRAQEVSAGQSVVERLPDEEMVSVMAAVTTRFRVGDPLIATMLRREFQFGTDRRSAVWNGR